MSSLKAIIVMELRKHGQVDNGVSDAICLTIEPILQSILKEGIQLTDAATKIYAGMLAGGVCDSLSPVDQITVAIEHALEISHQCGHRGFADAVNSDAMDKH